MGINNMPWYFWWFFDDLRNQIHGSIQWLLYTVLSEQQDSAEGYKTKQCPCKNVNSIFCLILAALGSNLSDHRLQKQFWLKNSALYIIPLQIPRVLFLVIQYHWLSSWFSSQVSYFQEKKKLCDHTLCPLGVFLLSPFPQASESVSEWKREVLKVLKLPQVHQQLRGRSKLLPVGRARTTRSLRFPCGGSHSTYAPD